MLAGRWRYRDTPLLPERWAARGRSCCWGAGEGSRPERVEPAARSEVNLQEHGKGELFQFFVAAGAFLGGHAGGGLMPTSHRHSFQADRVIRRLTERQANPGWQSGSAILHFSAGRPTLHRPHPAPPPCHLSISAALVARYAERGWVAAALLCAARPASCHNASSSAGGCLTWAVGRPPPRSLPSRRQPCPLFLPPPPPLLFLQTTAAAGYAGGGMRRQPTVVCYQQPRHLQHGE